MGEKSVTKISWQGLESLAKQRSATNFIKKLDKTKEVEG
jgi:hypothetical protein